MRSLITAILVCCLVVLERPAAGDDWPQWMGARMDGVWREAGLIDRFPEGGPAEIWRVDIGPGYSGPSVANGRLFVMDRTKDDGAGGEVENNIRQRGEIPGGERILCVDTATGETVWQHQYDCPYRIAYPTGPRCTPTVDDDRVYTLGAMGHLICLSVADGQVIWQKDLTQTYNCRPPVWGYSSHPIVDGPRLIVPVGGEGSAVVAFDKMTGDELWRSLTSSDVAYAPLVMYEYEGERQLISWHGDGVDSLNPETGEHYWHLTFPEEKVQAAATSIVTPRIVGDLLLVSEYYKGSLVLRIQSNPPGVQELYRTYATDPKNEKSLNALMTTPVIQGDLVYGIAGDGQMRCVQLEDHALVWENTTFMGEKPIEFLTMFIVENDGRYFMFCDTGELLIGEFSPEKFVELGRAKILDPTGAARGRRVLWSHPAFAGGCMYARNDASLVCIDLRKE